jgi:hypothetical protein
MTSLAADSTSASTSYAAEVTRLLWPDPWSAPTVTRSRRRTPPGGTVREAYVFPSTRNPRLLVPADVPAAATMVQRLGNDRTFLVGPLRRLLTTSVGSPLFTLARWPRLTVETSASGSGSIESHLAEVLGTDVRVGVVLGPRRINQKPVLQVFGRDGALLAFAKIGHNSLTSRLVRHESRSLARIEDLAPRHFRAPHLLHAGTWSGLDLLVMSPLTIDPREEVGPETRDAAMVELATMAGVRTSTLADSAFWQRLRGEVDALADTEQGDSIARSSATLEERWGSTQLGLGGWHGDWGPWNMGMECGVLQLWDWERHDAEVPLGFDGVHLLAQRVRALHPDEQVQADELLGGVGDALAPFGIAPELHGLTMRLYLLEIAVRYTDALRVGARPDFERRTRWVVALLERLLEDSLTASPEGRP